MTRTPQRYRGVRQRHWGSWVSKIRHPLLKTRIWLGTFETAEDAARAYHDAARLMCGPKVRTNFPYDPSQIHSSSNLLSAALTAKLQKCHVASVQLTKKASAKEPRRELHGSDGGERPAVIQWNEMNWESSSSTSSSCEDDCGSGSKKMVAETVEDDHIEQMIEELLDCGSVELCSAVAT